MYGAEMSQAEQHAQGQFNVTLSSVGNPDYDQDPESPLSGVKPKTVAARTLAEASVLCRAYIAEHELGGGNWAGGEVTADGETVALISYNGRIWRPA